MSALSYSVIVATYERTAELAGTLASLAQQTRPAERIIIIDASREAGTETLCQAWKSKLPLHYERAQIPSAAAQRNQGAALATTPLIAFVDDDVVLSEDLFARCLAPFESDELTAIAGIAARIEGQQHAPPRGLLWWYYRVQAGYRDRDYAARLFGPAINTLPAYRESDQELIPAEWLNTTCVLYRRAFFEQEKFPAFTGYSFMEDAHLAARMRWHGRLYFHKTALFAHHDAPSTFKKNVRQLARARFRHQRLIARELLHQREPTLTLKLLLHRLFVTACVLRARKPDCWQEVAGVWM